MVIKTTYIATVSVPAYASWKCERCGEINYSDGHILCRRMKSTGGWTGSEREKAKNEAYRRAQEDWVREAYKIIADPNHNAMALYNSFFLKSTDCTNCGKKPRWDKHAKFVGLTGIAMIVAPVSGIFAVTAGTNLTAWLFFACSAGFFVWNFMREARYKKIMLRYPGAYTPVIGTRNAELNEYADELGKTIPSPDESFAIAKAAGRK